MRRSLPPLPFILMVFLICTGSLAAQELRSEMLVSTEWLASHLGQVKLVDITDQETYTAGHIPGAMLIEPFALLTQRGNTRNELPMIDALADLFTRSGIGERRPRRDLQP